MLGGLRQSHDGLEMFQALIEEVDQEYARPFDARSGMVA
jgi:hypothetical protein